MQSPANQSTLLFFAEVKKKKRANVLQQIDFHTFQSSKKHDFRGESGSSAT
jgi:hypothetical protein